MQKIRVLLANQPQMMRQVVRELIERQPDMEIVGESLDTIGVLLAAKETAADAVIITLQNAAEPGLISHLLAECPHVTILELSVEGDVAFIVQMCPRRMAIADPSEATIIGTLRQTVRVPCSEAEE